MSAPRHIVESATDWLVSKPLAARERDELLGWVRLEMARRYAGNEDDPSAKDMLVEHLMDEFGIDDDFTELLGVDADGLAEAVYALCGRAGWPWDRGEP